MADERIHGGQLDCDVIVVGASIAGCSSAILLARAGASVLVIDRVEDMSAYKVVCGHNMQGATIPVLRRLGLLEPMLDAGAVRSRTRIWTEFGGWIEPPAELPFERSINLRRRHLDPLLRELCAQTVGVDLRLGSSITAIDQSDPETVTIEFADRDGNTTTARSKLLVGADGRSSTVAKLAGFKERRTKNGRFNYGAYFEGPSPSAPDNIGWFGNPQWAGSFPTDSSLTGYYIMPTKDRLPQFKADREGAIRAVIAALPQAPPVDELKLVGDIVGDVELPGFVRPRFSGRVALVGDAALTSDPLFGVGAGWAFESAGWLADAVTPAIAGDVRMDAALKKYRSTARRALFPHAFQVQAYASGRKFDPFERMIYRAAARDEKIATELGHVGTRSAKGTAFLRPSMQARMVRARWRKTTIT